MSEGNIDIIIRSLEAQLNHRLQKLWNVFNWSSGILVAITAGVISLKRNAIAGPGFYECLLISAVILIFTLYAYLMIKENLKYEGRIRDQLDIIFENDLNYPQIKNLRPDKAVFGFKIVVLLLGAAALIATWIR